MNNKRPRLPQRAGFIGAHPDDIETMLGGAVYRTPEAYAIIATNGEASTLDFRSNRLC